MEIVVTKIGCLESILQRGTIGRLAEKPDRVAGPGQYIRDLGLTESETLMNKYGGDLTVCASRR